VRYAFTFHASLNDVMILQSNASLNKTGLKLRELKDLTHSIF